MGKEFLRKATFLGNICIEFNDNFLLQIMLTV